MDKFIEEHWSNALDELYEPQHPESEPLAKATEVFLRVMDPNRVADIPARVKGSISLLISKGLARWEGTYLLDTFRKDALENVVPLLQDIESQYQTFIDSPTNSAEWVIPAFYNVIHAIHARFAISKQLARLFDEELRIAASDSTSLEVLSRFETEFATALANRLPPSFDQVARLYFETVFRQYELSRPVAVGSDLFEESTWSMDMRMDGVVQSSTVSREDQLGDANAQQLGKKKRLVMQDGSFAMDPFVDDMDGEVVEQIFHGSHVSADLGALDQESDIQMYLDLCHMLEEIGFISNMTDVVTRMLYEKVEGKIFNTFKNKWNVPTLANGKDWMSLVILPFLRLTLLPEKDQENPWGKQRYKMWASRLEFYFFKNFGDLRIKEFFDIIVECPDSEPAVLDLKTCLEWTGQREQLQNAILQAMQKRLLHPGAETTDAIEFYICTIKYLRKLDPSGVMLDRAARAINQYLRTRDDTMRAIVSCIVDDSNDLLTNSTEGIQTNAEADDDESDDEIWKPEPANSGPDLSSARRRMADIISVLANIYDTNDRFIEEFQTILADRLLQATDFSVDREIRQLELLKLRFGDTDLQHCEVMLADVAESKRVNANIQSLHPNVMMLESYNTAFQTSKPAQKLSLLPSLGLVELELELQDRTLQFQVEPVHASIIYLFEDQGIWTLSAIAEELKVAEDTLEQKIQFWVREGVLREPTRFQYQLIEDSASSSISSDDPLLG
ncbi:Anaphase-promoting complex subunit 2 [Dissophora globulifera]|uniref:Anaphase-promoting complex subunit 2 n=1 Tax=Dissophora globulifera TaxID=979702 RepID=A0A9P6RN46_9FUNG|nr:Anaphase-promoting complex subunit 2 [Dissophora globulifera]